MENLENLIKKLEEILNTKGSDSPEYKKLLRKINRLSFPKKRKVGLLHMSDGASIRIKPLFDWSREEEI